MPEIPLNALTGNNPLAFLAALGTFRILSDAVSPPVRMGWHPAATGWVPAISWDDDDPSWCDPWLIAGIIACELGAPARATPEHRLRTVVAMDDTYKSEKKALAALEKSLKEEGKTTGLKGADLSAFISAGTLDMRNAVSRLRASWLAALQQVVLSPELGLGKTLAVTIGELRDVANRIAGKCSQTDRLVADLVAAFGAEGRSEDDYIQATEFCFVTGSGQQFFLETIQKLLHCVSVEKIKQALFDRWTYDDLRFSMRWDPVDDRRYALMWSDPTAQGNETRTNWAANLLAYYGLSFFPCFTHGRSVNTTGFNPSSRTFTWPIWSGAICCGRGQIPVGKSVSCR